MGLESAIEYKGGIEKEELKNISLEVQITLIEGEVTLQIFKKSSARENFGEKLMEVFGQHKDFGEENSRKDVDSFEEAEFEEERILSMLNDSEVNRKLCSMEEDDSLVNLWPSSESIVKSK
nr:hypothetical protein HmN_001007800 [Hymenolepis microstoma]CUU98263.1 hypothetical transcript [Hymenolepis microstoma]